MECRIALTVTLAIVAGHNPGLTAPPPSAGQLLDARGRVEIRRGKEPARPGTLLFQLRKDDVVTVGDGGASEIVLFRNGARFGLTANSAVRVGLTGVVPLAGPHPRSLPKPDQPFAQALVISRRPVPQKLMGLMVRNAEDDTMGPRHPAPNGAVREAPVTFRWEGPIDGQRLVLQISDGDRIVHRAEMLPTARSYQAPKGALRHGAWYIWFLTATSDSDQRQKCYALVRVILPRERAALERLEREMAATRTAAPEQPASLLLLAQAYERLGMFSQARQAYEAVLRLRPEDEGVRAALQRLASPGEGASGER